MKTARRRQILILALVALAACVCPSGSVVANEPELLEIHHWRAYWARRP